jgi:hypothetical protein
MHDTRCDCIQMPTRVGCNTRAICAYANAHARSGGGKNLECAMHARTNVREYTCIHVVIPAWGLAYQHTCENLRSHMSTGIGKHRLAIPAGVSHTRARLQQASACWTRGASRQSRPACWRTLCTIPNFLRAHSCRSVGVAYGCVCGYECLDNHVGHVCTHV